MCWVQGSGCNRLHLTKHDCGILPGVVVVTIGAVITTINYHNSTY